MKKLQQFHKLRVVEPKKPQELRYEQRRKSLAYLMFLKLNNDEVAIKGRGFTDGTYQHEWLSTEDTSSPTVSTEGLMLSCIIETMEGQDVATDDLPWSFLKTDYEKGDININMEG